MPPSPLTPGFAAKLAEALKSLPVKLACAKVGIHEATYHRWRQQAEEGVQPYASLIGLCEQARAERALELVDAIRNAGSREGLGNGDWKAAAWLLQKLQPSLFGDKAAEGDQPEQPHKVTIRREGKAAGGGGDAPA